MIQPTNLRNPSDTLKLVIPMTLILGIGTGGAYTAEFLRVREAKLVFGSSQSSSRNSVPIKVEAATKDLSFIRSVLKISTSDLAKTLGVSRQAIYNWKAGSLIKAQNLSRLANLRSAAEIFVQARTTVTAQMLDRKLHSGKTFLESLAHGAGGSETAILLLNLVNQEAEHRRSLDDLLAENVSRPGHNIGSPALREG